METEVANNPGAGRLISPFSIDEVPARHEGISELDGYVYAIEFSDKTVKVGLSHNPRARLKIHQRDADKFNLKVNRAWVSAPHETYRESEKALIAWGGDMGSGVSGAEYFRGVDLDALVNLAQGLTMSIASAEAIENYQAEREAKGAIFKACVTNGPLKGERPDSDNLIFMAVRRGSVAAKFLPMIADPRVNLPEPEEGGTPTPLKTLEALASVYNMDLEEVLEASPYEWYCGIVDLIARELILDLKEKMIKSGHDYFNQPGYKWDGVA